MDTPDSGRAWVRRGASRILLVAPHGGRRAAVDPLNPPANLRVNDVFTPEITRRLAERLDATAIINESVDRNTTDLNRISQVRKRAPWFLEVILAEIERIRMMHGSVTALFIHGWNTGQPVCDLGIGGSEVDGELIVPEGATVTVGDDFRSTTLEQFRHECRQRGIATTIGERYPASHRNNVLQLFAHEPQRCVNAVQLELSIPLRWPGEWSDHFLDACVAAFAPPSSAGATAPRATVANIAAPVSLQFYDPRAGVGLFAGVGRLGHVLGGRLLLFLGDKRIALFTGEALVRGGRSLQPLEMTGQGADVELRFDGPMLFLEDGADYLDLEAAFVRSRLVRATVGIRVVAGQGDGILFGRCVGRLHADGREHVIDAFGFANAGTWRGSGAHEQTMLSVALGNGAGLLAGYDHSRDKFKGIRFSSDGVVALAEGRVEVETEADPFVPRRLTLQSAQMPSLSATPLSRMSILRTGVWGASRVTFGVARFESDGGDGFGVFEYARPIGSAADFNRDG